MDRSKLEEFNHWWLSGNVDPDLALPFKRDGYPEIWGSISKRFILALVGLRRTGKTTTIYQIIQKLLMENVERTNILFFSFDEESATLDDVIGTYREIHDKDLRSERTYIFLDEIQKCGGWENGIKKYYDLYPKLKFVISGSESLFIRKRTKETLAGRLFEFKIMPFGFKEYLRFKGITGKELRYETRIKPFFLKFLERGGFPEAFSLEGEREFKEYIMSLVVDKVVYKDIPKLFKIEDPDFLKVLIEIIATNPGMYVDYLSLSGQFGKDRRVIKDYLSYLEESFLIRVMGNYRKNSVSTLRKKKRAYPTDNAIIYLYKSKPEKDFFGRIVEAAAVNKLGASSFWKNGNEIDIVHEGVPIEIKYKEQIGSNDLKPLREFMTKFGSKEGILVTKLDEKEIVSGAQRIKLVPAWKWFLQD